MLSRNFLFTTSKFFVFDYFTDLFSGFIAGQVLGLPRGWGTGWWGGRRGHGGCRWS